VVKERTRRQQAARADLLLAETLIRTDRQVRLAAVQRLEMVALLQTQQGAAAVLPFIWEAMKLATRLAVAERQAMDLSEIPIPVLARLGKLALLTHNNSLN
jgi:hypothetical protein